MLKKKISKILIGTNNKGKLKEIRNLLPKNIKLLSTSDFKLKSPVENGKTLDVLILEFFRKLDIVIASDVCDYEDFDIEASDEGTFFINLPMSQVRVEVRLLLGKDEKYLAQLAANKQKGGLNESPLTDQFKRIIISVNGHRNKIAVDKFVDNMPARDSRYLRSAYSKIVPNVDMKFGFDCSKCNHHSRVEVPLGPGFLWPSS